MMIHSRVAFGAATIRERLYLLALTFTFSALLPAQAIEGHVVNRVTRAGIEGASVTLYTRQGVRYETTTAGGGFFRVTGVQAGQYRSSLQMKGYEQIKDHAAQGPEPEIRISGNNTAEVTLELIPWTTLRGQVVDPEGRAVPNAAVEMWGPRSGGLNHDEIVSGSDGSYVLSRLLPGSVVLRAKPREVRPNAADGVRIETVPTFYPSALERSQAVEVAIRGIAEEAGYRIELRRARCIAFGVLFGMRRTSPRGE
jgi:hypothetical protein